METRAGVLTSPQVAIWDVISNLATANFKIASNKGPVGFLIKNETDTSVWLNVMPLKGSAFVPTKFAPGWNCELVREIQLNATAGLDLKWGY